MIDVAGYLAAQKSNSSPTLATEWTDIEDMYNKKLWHQLTVKLLEFIKNPVFNEGDSLLKLYENLIVDIEHRINPLSLAEIAVVIVEHIKEFDDALAFIEKIREKVKANGEASVLCMTRAAVMRLVKNDLEGTKKLIEEAQAKLDEMDGVSTVHSRFYDVSSSYFKVIGDHASYYRDALRFLGCIKLEDIPGNSAEKFEWHTISWQTLLGATLQELHNPQYVRSGPATVAAVVLRGALSEELQQKERAFNLSLAALLGEGVYNFGELLAHPILLSLNETDNKWLVELLYAFNSGNLEQFETMMATWKQQPDLAVNELPLRQKISLLCLMEMTFSRPANNRTLTFQEIADAAKLPVHEVEILVMKALSLGLVKGYIDQVEQKVIMSWVQPRVLDNTQISKMQTHLQSWCGYIKTMQVTMEDKAHDILDRV